MPSMYIVRKVVNENVLLNVYHAYVGSTLKYGILFWGNSTNKEFAFKAQKKCIRSICGLKQTDSCRAEFRRLKLLTLASMYILEAASITKRDISNYESMISTRHRNELKLPKSRTVKFKSSVFCMSVKIYNKLPDSIKSIQTLASFKYKLKAFLIQKVYYTINEYLNDKCME